MARLNIYNIMRTRDLIKKAIDPSFTWFNRNLQKTITKKRGGTAKLWILLGSRDDCYFNRPRNLTEADYANPVTRTRVCLV